ncbi:unnamed protein product [Phytophthora fragariaefolia]|uniref:Unnamed protein product n=1 Tax=Phytophthora fragariaefolia TaxID=1490495 RepID=A0A9W6YJF0_9STRA|nr:unnamed protein product [Phytophthora fragariaefolia]
MLRDTEPPAVQTPQYQWPAKLLLRPQGQAGTVRMVRLHDKPKPLIVTISKQLKPETSGIKSVSCHDERPRAGHDIQGASSTSGNDCPSVTEAGVASFGQKQPELERQSLRKEMGPACEQGVRSSGPEAK